MARKISHEEIAGLLKPGYFLFWSEPVRATSYRDLYECHARICSDTLFFVWFTTVNVEMLSD